METRDWKAGLSIPVIAYQTGFLRQSTNTCGEHQDASLRKHMHCGFRLEGKGISGSFASPQLRARSLSMQKPVLHLDTVGNLRQPQATCASIFRRRTA